MIKNVFLKQLLQNLVSFVFSGINKIVRNKPDKIMLYSNLGFRDNIKSLYDYLIENNYNERYTIVCCTNDYASFGSNPHHNVFFKSNLYGLLEYLSSGTVFYCFGKIPVLPAKNQKVVQMWHGAPFKAPDEGMLKGHSLKRQFYTNVLSTSANFVPFWSYALSVPEDKVLIGGQPRCDVLYKHHPKYDFGTYDKMILWTPTFRKSAIAGYGDTKNDNGIVPVLDVADFQTINEYLKSLSVKIVVKLHPLQDLSSYELVEMDHFILLSHSEMISRNMDLYKLMTQADAMITDYSSIFYDYLLLDRPIGFTEDDMTDYGDTRGFAVDDPDKYRPGFRIRTKEDLMRFVKSLAEGSDQYRDRRSSVMDLSNDYRDGHFSERLLKLVGVE